MNSLQSTIVSLLGIPYRFWDPKVSCAGDTGPFYAFNGPLPPLEQIQKEQMNCAGFLNLLCRSLGVPIPGAEEKFYYAGGTVAWIDHFRRRSCLRPFQPWIVYPEGTLLLREYRSIDDQGHIALYMGPNSIVHSWPEGGTCFATIQPHYYEFVCLPEDWMQPAKFESK